MHCDHPSTLSGGSLLTDRPYPWALLRHSPQQSEAIDSLPSNRSDEGGVLRVRGPVEIRSNPRGRSGLAVDVRSAVPQRSRIRCGGRRSRHRVCAFRREAGRRAARCGQADSSGPHPDRSRLHRRHRRCGFRQLSQLAVFSRTPSYPPGTQHPSCRRPAEPSRCRASSSDGCRGNAVGAMHALDHVPAPHHDRVPAASRRRSIPAAVRLEPTPYKPRLCPCLCSHHCLRGHSEECASVLMAQGR